MADDAIIIEDANAVDRNVDTRTIGTDHRQVVVIGDPATGAGVAPVDATTGLTINGNVQVVDGATVADVLDLTNTNPLTVAVVDGSGTQITTFGGSGGTAEVDDADFTVASTSGTPVMGVYEATPSSVTNNDLGIAGITATRELKVNVSSSGLDVAHGSADSGDPVKVGAKASSALPTAVDASDRANAISDLFGRLLTGHIAPEMQVWKRANATTAQTGAVIWDPTAGKRIAITHFTVGTRDSTAASGRLVLWFGANGDTAYDAGTDQLVFEASFAPSASVMPGAVVCPATPIYCQTADYELHYTTDAALSVDIAVYGYEW